jgi:threonylcarbamoyladenosine tRNA methylthiotransferase MtaB
MFFSVYTLGCKLNQLETEAIADAFCREGFSLVPFDDKQTEKGSGTAEPGVIVINTCTVTSMAEQKARRVIRQALHRHPLALIVVTGCYAQMDKAAIGELDEKSSGRLFVVPGEKKDRVLDLPRLFKYSGEISAAGDFFDERTAGLAIERILAEPEAKPPPNGAFRFAPESFSSHSRGFLKIQDGCDRRCAYCGVSLARGKSQSLSAGEALKRLKVLERRDIAEAVLTGVNISQYRDSSIGLSELLELLLDGTEKIRLRLSSIEPDYLEPDYLKDDFFRVLANDRIRPHFHLSLQSGSAEILAKMGRPYTPCDAENAAGKLRLIRHDPFLACDIIAGFPGETEEEFEQTLKLCEKIGFAWIHAFPFSPRPGTAACNFPGKLSERDAARRVELLTELARKGRRDYVSRWVGKDVEAVVEASGRKGLLPGGKTSAAAVSENYLKLLINCREEPVPPAGALVRCRILQAGFGSYDGLAEKISNY